LHFARLSTSRNSSLIFCVSRIISFRFARAVTWYNAPSCRILGDLMYTDTAHSAQPLALSLCNLLYLLCPPGSHLASVNFSPSIPWLCPHCNPAVVADGFVPRVSWAPYLFAPCQPSYSPRHANSPPQSPAPGTDGGTEPSPAPRTDSVVRFMRQVLHGDDERLGILG
jgi:hypothetical protein